MLRIPVFAWGGMPSLLNYITKFWFWCLLTLLMNKEHKIVKEMELKLYMPLLVWNIVYIHVCVCLWKSPHLAGKIMISSASVIFQQRN